MPVRVPRKLKFRLQTEAIRGAGTIHPTASDETQYAFEGDSLTGEGKFSFFTSALLQGLQTGAADSNQRIVTFKELVDYVTRTVTAAMPMQHPRYWMYKARGDPESPGTRRPHALSMPGRAPPRPRGFARAA